MGVLEMRGRAVWRGKRTGWARLLDKDAPSAPAFERGFLFCTGSHMGATYHSPITRVPSRRTDRLMFTTEREDPRNVSAPLPRRQPGCRLCPFGVHSCDEATLTMQRDLFRTGPPA